jgi:hypothetical protein
MSLLEGTGFEGLFVCLRSQSKPAVWADQFGFNEPIRQAFLAKYGVDVLTEPFDRQAWRDLCGTFLTRFVAELSALVRAAGRSLGVGVPRGDVLGPPLGNATLEWRAWVRRGLVDALVIDQNSCQCPSMWHRLWPMHTGSGYLQDYVSGLGLQPLREDLEAVYGPAVRGTGTRLYVARQWRHRSLEEETAIRARAGVTGLVFGSFRHDNPGAIARGDWRA